MVILYNDSLIQRSWIAHGATVVKAKLWEGSFAVRSLLSLKEENARLEEERAYLLRELQKAGSESRTERESWINPRGNFSFLDAKVVTMSPGGQHNYMIIDRGYNDGVKEDDGLVTPRGAVGIVRSVSANYSYAISYVNANMVVSARIGHDGSVGAMSWSGTSSKKSYITGIPLHFRAEPGDTVYTSGFSSIFPPDIPVGTVVRSRVNDGSSADFEVDMFEDCLRLRHVTVVRNRDREEIESLEKE